MRLLAGALCCASLPAFSVAAEVTPETLQAFGRYVRTTETRLEQKRAGGPFLWADESPERLRRLREGQVVIEPWSGKGDLAVPGGLIHDWVGAVFIPGGALARTLALVQDYGRHKDTYKPEVVDSRILSRNGD